MSRLGTPLVSSRGSDGSGDGNNLAAALNVVYLVLQAILNNRLTDAVAAAAIILAILAPFFLFLLVGVIANEAKTPYRSRIVALSFAFVLWLVVPPFL